MGNLLERAAHCLNEPVVRSTDTGTDWRHLATAHSLPAGDGLPIAIDSPDPLAYAAQAIAALVAGRSILLCNPHWTRAERAAAEALRQAPATGGNSATAPRILIATGGSSGSLRFATHSPETLEAAALAYRDFRGGASLNSLCLLPLYHIGGFQQLIRALATGGQLLLGDWHAVVAGRLPEAVPADGRWTIPLVPAQLQRLLGDSSACSWLRGFSSILLGGAPAAATLLEEARGKRLPVSISYGASEFGAALAVQPPGEFLDGETGLHPLPHASIRLLDSEPAKALPPGALGRIEVCATSLFHGYWPHERTPGPFRTEDLGCFDSKGRLHVVGRADNAINTGGEKVHPAEIEAALRATGAFSEVFVLGLPAPRWGECVTVLFPAVDAPDLAAVERSLRATLSPHKLPRRWMPVAAWPHTTAGKTDRAALRALASSG